MKSEETPVLANEAPKGNVSETLLRQLDEVIRLEHIKQNSRFLAEAKHLQARAQSKAFKVAVVGEFNAGKSTFINAILKQDILKHAKEPTTACITHIVNIPKKSSPGGTVFFRDGKTKELDNFVQMTEFSTTMSDIDVSQEVEYIKLMLPFWDDESELVLVDTPGLNGMYDNHRDLTIDEVQDAHACIYLFQLRGVSESDVEFIKILTSYQTHFLFVLNFIDDLPAEEGITPEAAVAKAQQILEEQVFNELGGDYHFDVCGVSALLALASKDSSIKRLYKMDETDITDNQRSQFWKESRFEQFYKAAGDIFSADAHDKIKNAAVRAAFKGFLTRTKADAEHWIAQTKELQAAKTGSGQIEILAVQKERFDASKDRKHASLINFIDSRQSEIRKQLKNSLKDQVTKFCEDMRSQINNERDYDTFKRKIEHDHYNTAIRNTLSDIDLRHKKDLLGCLQNLLENALLRARESCNWKEGRTSTVTFDVRGLCKEDTLVNVDLNEKISQINKDIQETESESTSLRIRSQSTASELNEKTAEWDTKEQEKIEIVRNQRSSISRLGARPAAKTKYKKRTVREKRDGWGIILDFFIGLKEGTRTESYLDDSARQQWDREKSEIDREAAEKRLQVEKHQHKIDQEIRAIEGKLEEDKHQEQYLAKKVQRLKKMKEDIESYYREWEEKARNELFRNRKNDLQQRIESYLLGDEGALSVRVESMENDLKENVKIIKKQAEQEFEEVYKKQLDWFTQILTDKHAELQKPLHVWEVAVTSYTRILKELAHI